MDLSQVKLTKKEWSDVEIPVSDKEKEILRLILDGYHNVNIRYNRNPSLLSMMKIDSTPEVELYLFAKYFEKQVKETIDNWGMHYEIDGLKNKSKTPKKKDMMRLNNMETSMEKQKLRSFEFILLEFMQMKPADANVTYNIYTLIQLRKSTIPFINTILVAFVDAFINRVTTIFPKIVSIVFHRSRDIIERNPNLLKYQDMTLYDHQKQLFQILQNRKDDDDLKSVPRLILYMAPTGTGKTMSPLGISCGYRVIFICAARHVGLALAKSAISMEKCVAFAFGCETASDIRLHYYSAAEYTKNKKSGGIYKVDNSDGRKVEIMICDVASYLIAMWYMLNFNEEKNIVLYWDEPTIGLDVEHHPLHTTINQLWTENKISKVVLSCATLPKEELLEETMVDFRNHYEGAEISTISSFDCKKSITILDAHGKCVLPHILFESYSDVIRCVEHCLDNKGLLRYFDVKEIVRFVEHVEKIKDAVPEPYHIDNFYSDIHEISLLQIKLHYLEIIKHINQDLWPTIYNFMKSTLPPNFQGNGNGNEFIKCSSANASLTEKSPQCGVPIKRSQSVYETPPMKQYAPTSTKGSGSGILLTTEDAHTLTDGPTIFIAEDVNKIGKFYIQQTKIPERVFETMMEKIGANNQIQRRMDIMLKQLDDVMGEDATKDKKVQKETFKPEVKKLLNTIESLRGEISMVSIDPVYLPNTRQHQKVWLNNDRVVESAFVPFIDEETVREIMELDVDIQMKILLLLGIGVFIEKLNTTYMTIMKRLTQEQRLFLIIASSDYIYGTNYQLCHAFLGKDLLNMTQQKIIQAMGRVGRGNIQQEYTVRFRDESLLTRLFLPVALEDNIEARIMCSLLVHD
jgi:hypothetical protein